MYTHIHVYCKFNWYIYWYSLSRVLCPRFLKGVIFILRRGDIICNLLDIYKFCKIGIGYVNHRLASRKPELRLSLDAAHSSGIRRQQLLGDSKRWQISWATQSQVSLAHDRPSAISNPLTWGFGVSNISRVAKMLRMSFGALTRVAAGTLI
jgi:hypothetical protein